MADSGSLTLQKSNAFNRDIIAMTIPLFLMAFFFYGPRVFLIQLVAWFTARLSDRVAALFKGIPYDKTENSSVAIAFLIVLMFPATVRYRVVVAAVALAVLIGKEAFGGYDSYPFNPVAVGFGVAAISWPDELMRFPAPTNWFLSLNQDWQSLFNLWSFKDATLVEGPSYILRTHSLPSIDTWGLLLGNYAGPIGVTSALVIIACGAYLVVKKRLSLTAPLSFIGVTAVIGFLFPRNAAVSWGSFPGDMLLRLNVVKFELLTGGLLFVCVFLISDWVTLPKHKYSQALYGVFLGVAAMMFRYFGTYELSICFAILLVNAFYGYFDRAITNYFGPAKEVQPL